MRADHELLRIEFQFDRGFTVFLDSAAWLRSVNGHRFLPRGGH